MMTLAAVVCCAMMTIVQTSCTSYEDNPVTPSADYNNGVVLNLDGVELKPYIQFGASLDDVEKYVKANHPEWKQKEQDGLQYSDGETTDMWVRSYGVNDDEFIMFSFNDEVGTNLRIVSYFYNRPIAFKPVMDELERNGYAIQGVLQLPDDPSDVAYMFLSADKSIEAQFLYSHLGSFGVSFQPTDQNDFNYLVPEPEVKMADCIKLYMGSSSLYQLDTNKQLSQYVIVDGTYVDANGETKHYDLSNIVEAELLDGGNYATADLSQLNDLGYIRFEPKADGLDMQFFVEDLGITEMFGSHNTVLKLTNKWGETVKLGVILGYVYPNEVTIKKEIKLADLDENGGYTIEVPEFAWYEFDKWGIDWFADAEEMNFDGGLWGADLGFDGKLYVTTDGAPSTPGEPGTMTYTFTRHMPGTPSPKLPETEGLVANFRINLELTVTE